MFEPRKLFFGLWLFGGPNSITIEVQADLIRSSTLVSYIKEEIWCRLKPEHTRDGNEIYRTWT